MLQAVRTYLSRPRKWSTLNQAEGSGTKHPSFYFPNLQSTVTESHCADILPWDVVATEHQLQVMIQRLKFQSLSTHRSTGLRMTSSANRTVYSDEKPIPIQKWGLLRLVRHVSTEVERILVLLPRPPYLEQRSKSYCFYCFFLLGNTKCSNTRK